MALLSININGDAQVTIRSHSNSAVLRISASGKSRNIPWKIAPETRPDSYTVALEDSTAVVTFITDTDSIQFDSRPGKQLNFVVILNDKDSAFIQIRCIPYVEPSKFTDDYIRKNKNKTLSLIPEFYEFFNIVIALTPAYQKNSRGIERGNDYYFDMINHFSKYKEEEVIKKIDTMLGKGMYPQLKMDSYVFEFDKKSKVIKSNIFDRISWGYENTIEGYIPALEKLAEKTSFRIFFKNHLLIYESQIKFYNDSANIAEMVRWLYRNFPSIKYDAYKIIWSPLVGGSQSAKWFENNGFREAQFHVNFPYRYKFKDGSDRAINLKRGDIVFTEMNHAFINPESEKPEYKKIILEKFSDISKWADGETAKFYPAPLLVFNEYMNWALVSLRYRDYLEENSELEELIKENEHYMQTRRGFIRFAEFNRFLIDLYGNRKPGQTLSDLYPALFEWIQKKY